MTKKKQDSHVKKANRLVALGCGLLAIGSALTASGNMKWIPIFVLLTSAVVLGASIATMSKKT